MVKELGGNAVAFTSILEVQALPPHHVAETSYLEHTLHHLSSFAAWISIIWVSFNG
jgi:hypothetical protein